jgi:hypothetical protein
MPPAYRARLCRLLQQALLRLALLGSGAALPLHRANAQPTTELTPTPIVVPSGGVKARVWISLNSKPEPTDLLTPPDWILYRELVRDTVRSRVLVELDIAPVPQGLGNFALVWKGADGKAKGEQRISLIWAKLPDPIVRIFRAGAGAAGAGDTLTLPAGRDGARVPYIVQLSAKEAVFLSSDRIRFDDAGLVVRTDEAPAGPTPLTASNTAEFRVLIDPGNPPQLGSHQLAIFNPQREGVVTYTEITVVTKDEPKATLVTPSSVAPGDVTFTLRGELFDRGASVVVTGVSARGATSEVLADVRRENATMLQVRTTVSPNWQQVQFKVRNSNNAESGALQSTVLTSINSLVIEELAKGGLIYPDQNTTLTVKLTGHDRVLAPTPGTAARYRVLIDNDTLKPEVVDDGRLRVIYRYPNPKHEVPTASDIVRAVSVLRDGVVTWQNSQGLVVQLPAAVDTLEGSETPLLPNQALKLRIRGRHFREKQLSVLAPPDFSVVYGTVTSEMVEFTLRAPATVAGPQRVNLALQQGQKPITVGAVQLATLPSAGAVVSFFVTDGKKSQLLRTEQTNPWPSDQTLMVRLDGSKLGVLPTASYLISVVVDSVGEPSVVKDQQVTVRRGETASESIFVPQTRNLHPGKVLRITATMKDQADQVVKTKAQVVSTWLQRTAVLMGVAALRRPFNDEARGAVLSDIVIGAEYRPTWARDQVGLGGGVTFMGAPQTMTASATLPAAWTISARFRELAFMFAKPMRQLKPETASASPAAAAWNRTATGTLELPTTARLQSRVEANTSSEDRPWYFMVGLTLRTSISDLLPDKK